MYPAVASSSGMARYVFVSDQGGVFTSCDDPTPEDLAYAAVGMVTIVRLADLHSYGSARVWVPVLSSELITTEIDGEVSSPFHRPADRDGGRSENSDDLTGRCASSQT